MLFTIRNGEELENLEALPLLQIQVKESRLKDQLGKQNFHESIKKSWNQTLIHIKIPLKPNKKFNGNLY